MSRSIIVRNVSDISMIVLTLTGVNARWKRSGQYGRAQKAKTQSNM